MNTKVVPIGRLSVEEYIREREQIRATYGDSSIEAAALRDQALAALFHRSGWTQEQLAGKEGKERSYIARRLLFGKFLAFVSTGHNSEKPPRGLTERRFRSYWERCDKASGNEYQRFTQVLRLIEEETTLVSRPGKKPKLANAILEQFADGHWHHVDTIVKAAQAADPDATADDVLGVLKNMMHYGSYDTRCERRAAGKGAQYRIVRGGGKKIDYEVLMKELTPLLKELEDEGKSNRATWSPPVVLDIAHRLKRALEKLAK